ncbi:MAG TPA: hypothetical protein VK507_19020 [Iamia sp.]|nr:hypothetical protein [Iamia sp.]
MAEVRYDVPDMTRALGAYQQLATRADRWSRACERVAGDLSSAQLAMHTTISPDLIAGVYGGDASALQGVSGGVPGPGMTGPGIDPMVRSIQEVLATIPTHQHQLGEIEQYCGIVGEHYAERASVYRRRAETLRGLLEEVRREAEPGPYLDSSLYATDVDEPPEAPEPAGAR